MDQELIPMLGGNQVLVEMDELREKPKEYPLRYKQFFRFSRICHEAHWGICLVQLTSPSDHKQLTKNSFGRPQFEEYTIAIFGGMVFMVILEKNREFTATLDPQTHQAPC